MYLAPEDELRQKVEYYWAMRFSDADIARLVMGHFDSHRYGIRYVALVYP